MDKLQEIKKQVERAGESVRLLPSEIKWLIQTVEQQEQEYITLAQSIAEDDAIIEQLQEEMKLYKLQETLLLERLKKQTLQIKEMKQNSRLMKFMEMAEENLALAQEVARLKGEITV